VLAAVASDQSGKMVTLTAVDSEVSDNECQDVALSSTAPIDPKITVFLGTGGAVFFAYLARASLMSSSSRFQRNLSEEGVILCSLTGSLSEVSDQAATISIKHSSYFQGNVGLQGGHLFYVEQDRFDECASNVENHGCLTVVSITGNSTFEEHGYRNEDQGPFFYVSGYWLHLLLEDAFFLDNILSPEIDAPLIFDVSAYASDIHVTGHATFRGNKGDKARGLLRLNALGGGCEGYHSILVDQESSFIDNHAAVGTMLFLYLPKCPLNKVGVTIEGKVVVEGNTASAGGGSILVMEEPLIHPGSTPYPITPVNVTLKGPDLRIVNNSSPFGLLSFGPHTATYLTMTGPMDISGVTAQVGGIVSSQGYLYGTFEDLSIASVQARMGGFLHASTHCDVTLKNVRMDSFVVEDGGGVFDVGSVGFYDSESWSSIQLERCQLGNHEAPAGGVIYTSSSNVNVTFTATEVFGNQATKGGVLYVDGGSVHVRMKDGSSFESNSGSRGAVCHVAGGSVIVDIDESSSATSNSATDYGGVMYVASHASGTIRAVDEEAAWFGTMPLHENSARKGGVLYVARDAVAILDGVCMESNFAAEGNSSYVDSRGTLLLYHMPPIERSTILAPPESLVCADPGSLRVAKDSVYSTACHGYDLKHVVCPDRLSLVHPTEPASCNTISVETLVLVSAIVIAAFALPAIVLAGWAALRRMQSQQQLADILLPRPIANQLYRGGLLREIINGSRLFVRDQANVVVMYIDVEGFTSWSSGRESDEVVEALKAFFGTLDQECARCGCLKIQTVGDCYVAAVGVLGETFSPAECLARGVAFAWRAVELIQEQSGRRASLPSAVRIGLSQGHVTTGIIGSGRLQFEVIGDTVNVAASLESLNRAQANTILLPVALRRRLEEAYPGYAVFSDTSRITVLEGLHRLECCRITACNVDGLLHCIDPGSYPRPRTNAPRRIRLGIGAGRRSTSLYGRLY